MKFIYVFLLTVFMFSCKEDPCCIQIDFDCYSFDIRQCQTDEFADEIAESESQSLRESLMKSWLTDNGFAVEKVKLEEGFHENVCEACDICPQGDRYYMQVTHDSNINTGGDVNVNLAETLRLLSFEVADCSVFE